MRGLVVLCAALLPLSAWADEPEDALQLARRHYEAGRDRFAAGDYGEAVREFAAGYEIAPRPEFLLNLGQAYRRLGDLPRARAFYEKYLVSTPESDPRHPQVREIVTEIAGELARVPWRPESAPAALKSQIVAPGNAPLIAPSPPHANRRRRLWWILPAAAVATAGAIVGIYFAAAPRSGCSAGAIDCLDLRQVR
jgi:tetratricopeptide (TPR) repeat protein